MAEATKSQTNIDVQPPHSLHSLDVASKDPQKEQKVPFFRSISQRGDNTWLISLFVIIHLVAFTSTMIVNDCWHNSHGYCTLKSLGRFSFQPLSENPLLGPSASAMDAMGAVRQSLLVNEHQMWRLFSSPWLHAGFIHLIVNLTCIIFIGIQLEQEFGALRIGLAYVLSAMSGSLVAALFLDDKPSVASSAALFGLIGTMLSALIQNWTTYSKKGTAIAVLASVSTINLILGMLPFVNNIANIGGLISGFLLGFVLLFKPQLGKLAQGKGSFFEYEVKCSSKLRQKLDRPVLRSTVLFLFLALMVGTVVAVTCGVNISEYCWWCKYLDCVSSKWWSCNGDQMKCEMAVSTWQLTLTCMSSSDRYMDFPFTNVTQARVQDLCDMICSSPSLGL